MSESEQIQSYDVPNTEGLSSDEAAATLEKIHTDVVANVRHPYCNKAHPQNKSFTAAVEKLYAIKNPEPKPQTNAEGEELIASCQYPQAVVDAMAEGLEIQKQKQNDIYNNAVEIVDELVSKYDFEPIDVRDDVTESEVTAWRMQKLFEEGTPASLHQLSTDMSAELKRLRTPSYIMEMYASFLNAKDTLGQLNKERYASIAKNIIGFILDANLKANA